jgi:hypothetical protein
MKKERKKAKQLRIGKDKEEENKKKKKISIFSKGEKLSMKGIRKN